MDQEKKRMLIISGTVPPDDSATAIVIQKLIPHWEANGWRIDALTVKHSFKDKKRGEYGNMSVYYADALLFRPKHIRAIRDFLFCVQKRLSPTKPAGVAQVFKELVVSEMVRSMETLPMHSYSAVIAVCAYYDAAEALLRYKRKFGLRGKTALYQVDPLAENKIYIHDNEIQLQRYEQNLYATFDHVFTTPIIYKEKEKLHWDMSTVTALEFPLSFNRIPRQERQPHEEICCVYAGYLYGKLRDASFTLDLFSKISDPRVHLYVVGKGQDALLRSYEEGALKGRLHILGEKPSAECDEILANADVLVNIGNTVNNQVPSKLFHYMSFGKPILNITACEDCPTLPYVRKYPQSLTVRDTKTADDNTVNVVNNWLQENYQKHTGCDENLRLFEECTPEFIANQIITKMKEEE